VTFRCSTALLDPRAPLAFGDVEATVAPVSALTRALTDPVTALELLGILAARLRNPDRKQLEFAVLDTLDGSRGGSRSSVSASARRPARGSS